MGKWWPLLLLAAIPLLVVLYKMKEKAKEKVISSTVIVSEEYKNQQSTRKFDQFRHHVLMYLEIIIILLTILLLLVFHRSFGTSKSEAVLLVIDQSASMSMEYKGSTTRLDYAKQQAKQYVDKLKTGSKVSVMAVGKKESMVLENETSANRIKTVIDKIQTTNEDGNLTVAQNRILAVQKENKISQTVLFTDEEVQMEAVSASIIDVSSQVNNLAITNLSYGEKDGQYEVLVQVYNHSTQKMSSDLDLYGDQQLVAVKNVKVEPKETKTCYFSIAKKDYEVFHSELHEKDGCVADNERDLVLGVSKEKKVLLVADSDIYIEKALATIPGWKVYLSKDSEVDTSSVDVVIYDELMPKKKPQKNAFYIGSKLKGKKLSNESFAFDSSLVSSDLEGVTFGANKAIGLNAPTDAKIYLATQKKDCVGYYFNEKGIKTVTLGVSLEETDFALQAYFPIYMTQVMNYLGQDRWIEQNQCNPGDEISMEFPGIDEVMVTTPNGKKEKVANGLFVNTKAIGTYQVELKGNEIKQNEKFVVQYPERESTYEGQVKNSVLNKQKQTVVKSEVKGSLPVKQCLLVVFLVLLILHWWVYVRE